jgi:O-methyltransferase
MATLPEATDMFSVAPPINGSSPATSSGDRYLDLLKRCLTRFDFDDDLTPIVMGSPLRRRVWAEVAKLLERRDIVAFRKRPFQAWIREEGRDWPTRAETMIGLRRLDNFQECIETAIADDIPGDVLEAGVWRGGAGILARATLAVHGDTDRTVWMADSFEGLPKPRPEHPADAEDMHWTQPFLAVSVDQVKANFARYGMLDDQVKFLEGWFADTLPTAPIDKLAVLRADGDMYGSTMDVLDALYDKVSVGGFVIIDDYGEIPQCRAAVEDFRTEHKITEPVQRIDGSGVFWRRRR